MIKKIGLYIGLFLLTVAVLFLIRVGSELIDRSAMQENMESSADYLIDRPDVEYIWDECSASRLDNAADTVSLRIAWQTDPENPFTSAMWSSLYSSRGKDHRENLKEVVENPERMTLEGGKDNLEYLRYWHGNVVLIRLLHLFTDLQGMHLFHVVVLAGLFLLLLILLWREGLRTAAIGLIAGGAVAGIWFVPFCLEYTWVFLIAFPVSVLALRWGIKEKWNRVGGMFLVTGIVTNYLDFLTTELLTLLLPLLILVAIRIRKEGRAPVRMSVKACLLWGVGYLGMWIMKWVIASIILGENVMPYVSAHISERIGVSKTGQGNPFLSLYRNLFTALPTGLGLYGLLFAILLIALLFGMWYVYRKRDIDKSRIILYAVLGLIPYVRYLVLFDHGYIHSPFTYRAQMATVLALALITGEIVDRNAIGFMRKTQAVKKQSNR